MTLLLGASLCASACSPAEAPALRPSDKPNEPDEPAPLPLEHEPVAPARAPAPETEPLPPSERPPPPAWFDPGKIEHAAVLSHNHSQGTIAGGYASAIVLELEAGVTIERCIELATGAMAESLTDIPAATAAADGRMTIQGVTEGYHYTVVCGEAKGKPTMYLSYTAQ